MTNILPTLTLPSPPSSNNAMKTRTTVTMQPNHQPPASSSQLAIPPISFPRFSLLPTEIRLRIWAFASNATPRNLDMWTNFHEHQKDNMIYYVQKYHCNLAPKAIPSILHVSHEAREEALHHFTLEFQTVFAYSSINHVNPARFYINYATDTLIPRGHWNICAYKDLKRRISGKLRSLALDVNGSFWKEILMERVVAGDEWAFEGLEEVILYDASKHRFLGPRDHYEVFTKKWDGRPRDLWFVDMEEGKERKKLDVAEGLLEIYFGKMGGEVVESPGTVEGEVVGDGLDGGGEEVEKTEIVGSPNGSEEEYDHRDIRIRVMKLIASLPVASP